MWFASPLTERKRSSGVFEMLAKRFRMIAGPNGSGKSTLVARLRDDFQVNFYSFVNADDILVQLRETGAYSPKFPVSKPELVQYAEASTYREDVKATYRSDAIRVTDDCVRFESSAITSYTVALFANFLQDRFLDRGESFSQETVFSHPSKVEALRRARENGYRTYLYFIATEAPEINIERVANRYAQGGHDVPVEKTKSRYARSIAQLKSALPFLSRAFVFDNSGTEMEFLGQYSEESGWVFNRPVEALPKWFSSAI